MGETKENRRMILEYDGIEGQRSFSRISAEEADDFLKMKREDAPVIANAVSMCILSPVVLIILAVLADSPMFGISEGTAVAVGCTVLFGMISAAVFLFITRGLRERHSFHIERENIAVDVRVIERIKEQRKAYDDTFVEGLAAGVVICILAVVPLIIAGAMDAPDYVCGLLVSVLLVMIAFGVNLIVRVSMVKTGFDALLQEGEFTQSEKRANRKMDAMSGAYWCFVTAIYLGWSFWTQKWDYTWIIWPVVGVLYAAIRSVMSLSVYTED